MTFQVKKVSPFDVDILTVTNSTAYDGSYNWLNISGSIVNTRATLSSDEITLPAGSHWRVTFSGGQQFAGSGSPGAQTTIQFYDPNAAAFVGIQAHCTGFSALTKGRPEACALILNSEISTSKTLRCYYKIKTSGTWQRTTAPIYDHLSMVIMELPA